MSHLRAPAARADRREGGRHGRPVARTAPRPPETHIRPQLLRIAVLPPVAVALSACAAVLFVVRSTTVRPSPALWAVLAGTLGVALAAILLAALAADRAARAQHDRLAVLRRGVVRGRTGLPDVVAALRRGERPPAPPARPAPGPGADEFDRLADDIARAQDVAITAVVQAAQLSSLVGDEQKVEVYVNLARRLQSLVHREILLLDELENAIEDPELLKGLFHVDHLATRTRRHAENLAVLGGAVSRRQWSNPVCMTEVLRAAIAEVEQYSRVKLVPPVEGSLRGHAVADVIHLLAELVENATVFSAPDTQVLLGATLVTSGLAVEVEDRGLGMPAEERHRMNALLADPDQVNVADLLNDGRIGLFVVSQLAKRHGIVVRLQPNIYGGVQAVLVVPQELLGPAQGAHTGMAAGPAAPQRETPPVPPATGAAPRPTAPTPVPPRAERAPGTRRTVTPADPDAAPLPVRGTGRARPNPADSAPGPGPGEPRPEAEHPGMLLLPRTGAQAAAPDSIDKPRLPRRRAQEHLAPQLRGGPLPRPDQDAHVLHDPGLMAAFRRGIGLAEQHQTEQHQTEQHQAERHQAERHQTERHQTERHQAETFHASVHTPAHPSAEPYPTRGPRPDSEHRDTSGAGVPNPAVPAPGPAVRERSPQPAPGIRPDLPVRHDGNTPA